MTKKVYSIILVIAMTVLTALAGLQKNDVSDGDGLFHKKDNLKDL